MISHKKLQQLINFKPHEGQQRIIDCQSRDIAIAAGRRFGKSIICAYIALRTFFEGLNDIKKGKRDSIKIWIIAPSYELTQKVFEYIARWMLLIDKENARFLSYRPFPQIKISEGVWIQGKSTENPAGLLGEEIDLNIIDEAPRISRLIYEQYLFPTTSVRRGRTIFIGSPFGQNWFYQKFNQLKETGGAFHFTSKDNPYLPQEEWERAKKLLPEQVFKQEYEASFLPDAAAVFRGIDAIVYDGCLKDSQLNHNYILGIDLGKHQDFTVLTIIDTFNNNAVYWDRFKEIDYTFQKERIKATARRYNNARCIIDSTSVGEPIREDLERDGLFVDDFQFTKKSKKELVEKLSIFIEQKLIWIPPIDELTDELKSFGYHLTDSGNVIYQAPQGLHDDCVMSLALAVWGLFGKAIPQTPLQAQLKGQNKKIDNYI